MTNNDISRMILRRLT